MTSKKPILTTYVYPPIEIRTSDWVAYYQGEEQAGRYGRGATREAAIKDLLEHYGDDGQEDFFK